MIFGENNFLSEIVWCYRERGISKTYWNNKHDIILFYVKKVGEHNFNCNVVLEPYSEEYLKKFKYEDEKGLYQIRGKNIQGSPVQKADGLTPKAEVLYPDLTYRQYMQDGMLPLDWWQIPLLNKSANERLGYPTQKPEALLERVIKASSNEGDIVADFFCGCGTTIAVAERLHRNWLGVDISHLAIKLIVNRLTKPYEEDEEKKRKWILENIEITGFPKDVASAKELARNTKDGRFGFQDWIV
ncbi:MAG: site-specific DNA-methyltransferase, partial [Ignavibacteriales bacterium]|nr:site-specific DNA-methyltransferase [Ignavibacteriales bacterium]